MANRAGGGLDSKRKVLNLAVRRLSIAVLVAMGVPLGLLRSPASQSASGVQTAVQSESEPLRFDVVSVKIDNAGTGGAGDRLPKNGTWKWTRIPLSFLISWAYDVSLDQVGGIPGAFQGPRPAFNIVAKMPADVTESQFRMMLRSLLADRFKLVTHRETREVAVNTLEVAKRGPTLQSARGECIQAEKSVTVPAGTFRCGEVVHRVQVKDGVITHEYLGRSVSMNGLAAALSANGPVVDDTGIKGLYDIDVKVETPLAAHTDDPSESFSAEVDYQRSFQAAFQRQLGLSIDLGKRKMRPEQFIVVDHVELPTPD